MNKHLAAALLTASVAGAGFTGFSITSALAQDEGSSDTPAAEVAEDGESDRGCRGHRGERAQALADTIGISVEDVQAAREAGQSPAEIAEENGLSRDELVAALIEERQAHLDEAVASGDLTQEEADEKAADLDEKVNDFVDGEGRGDGRRGPGGPDGADSEDGDDTAAEEGDA